MMKKTDVEYELLKDQSINNDLNRNIEEGVNVKDNNHDEDDDDEDDDDEDDEEDILFEKPTKKSQDKQWILIMIAFILFLIIPLFYVERNKIATFSNDFYSKVSSLKLGNQSSKITEWMKNLIKVSNDELIEMLSFENNKNYSSFLIKTKECEIPNSAIFDYETKELFESRYGQEYECAKPNVTNQIYRVNFTGIHIPDGYDCRAKEVIRRVKDEWYEIGKDFGKLSSGIQFFNNTDFIEITCDDVYKKIIPLIQAKKPQIGYYSNHNSVEKVNVLLFGIDSISRLNFHRHLLKTKKFVDEHGFIEFLGHHKVGKNTFPNLIPIVTGEKAEKWNELWNRNRKVDALPLIYSKYRRSGYLTAYMEDMTRFGLFTGYGKNGFIDDPVDYYMKPASCYIEDKLGFTDPCYQDRLETEIFYDYLGELFEATKLQNQSLFAHIHMATLTHNYINHAGYIDLPVYRFLKNMFDKNLHKNTVIFFFADHSLRFGPNTETKVAFYETKLPFFYVFIPDSLKLMNLNGQWYDSDMLRKILNFNTRRLTNHFDIHATLMHILDKVPVYDEQYGESLFTPINTERKCEESGIPTEYCACYHYATSTNQTDNQILGNRVVKHINTMMKDKHDKCAELELKTIENIQIRQDKSNKGKRVFTISFVTSPGNAKFQGFGEEDGEHITFPGPIDRLDRYEDQSKCVDDDDLRMFCYCKSLLNMTKMT